MRNALKFASLLALSFFCVPMARLSATESQNATPVHSWAQIAALTPTDGLPGRRFALSVAISRDIVVVGEDCRTSIIEACTLGSAVYVFVRPKSGWTNLTQVAKLTASDGGPADYFGYSVAVNGDTVAIGAFGQNSFSGAVYVFVKPTTGWADMTETAKLTALDEKPGDNFGGSVSISENATIAVTSGNAAYVFVKPGGGWETTSTFNAKLTSSDNTFQFGITAIAISGKTVVVGRPFFQGGATGPGAAYVFVRPARGWRSMTETGILTPSDGAPFDEFGLSVAISGKAVVVGSPQALGLNGQRVGAAYVFEEPTGGWTNVTQTARLTSTTGTSRMGSAVAIDRDTVGVGDFTFNVLYVFVKPQRGWTDMNETAQFSGADTELGYSVGIDGTTIVAGDPGRFPLGYIGVANVFEPVK